MNEGLGLSRLGRWWWAPAPGSCPGITAEATAETGGLLLTLLESAKAAVPAIQVGTTGDTEHRPRLADRHVLLRSQSGPNPLGFGSPWSGQGPWAWWGCEATGSPPHSRLPFPVGLDLAQMDLARDRHFASPVHGQGLDRLAEG